MGLSGAPAAGPLAPGQRWSVARTRAVVLRLIAGEPVFKLERWRERAEAAYLARQAAQALAPARPTSPRRAEFCA